MVWYSRVQRPTRHIIGHFEDGGILRFSHKAKLAKTVKKLSKNSWSDQMGAVAPSPASPSINMPLFFTGIFNIGHRRHRCACKIYWRDSDELAPVVFKMCLTEWMNKQVVKVIWQKVPHGGPIPQLGVTPGGRKLYHWIPGVGFPISVP